MSTLPEDRTLDATFALLREGYRFISNRCDAFGTDIFRTRLMLRPVVCMRGAEAAAVFYDGDRFTRRGAMPQTTLRLLQDKGTVQTLDGAAHRHRKALFLALMTPDRVSDLADLVESEWRARLPDWEAAGRLTLIDAVRPVLTAAVGRWAGVPIPLDQLDRRTGDLAAMIDYAGAVSPTVVGALIRRRRTERWAERQVRAVRTGSANPPAASAVKAIATFVEDGQPLSEAVAAVELINILRPTLAVDRFIVFAALALHRHPDTRALMETADDPVVEAFVQEVRRTTPFFPFIGGRVRTPFTFRGHDFRTDDWVLLDIHGTDHDPRLYDEPEHFRPDRFLARAPTAYDLVPQGAGDHAAGHRCPGEWITIALMKRAVRLLTRAMAYDVPDQDLTVDLSRMPALPRSGFVMESIRVRR